MYKTCAVLAAVVGLVLMVLVDNGTVTLISGSVAGYFAYMSLGER